MKLNLRLLSLVVTITATSIVLTSKVLADSIFVHDAVIVGSGTSADDGKMVTELVNNAASDAGKNQIITNEKSAKFSLRPKLLKLGSSYVVTIDKVQGDKTVFSDQLKASKIEELDSVVVRLTRAVLEEQSVQKNLKVTEVTESEVNKGNLRKEAPKHWYFGFGPFGASNLNSSGTLYNLSIAYSWEVTNAAIKIFWDGTQGSFGDLGLGVTYFFNDRDISPILEGDFGFGAATKASDTGAFNSESTSGFIAGAGAGVTMFRTSSINLELLGQFKILMNQNSKGSPMVYGVRVGLYF